MRPLALGVDLGGTNVRAAVVDAGSGEIVAAHKEPLRDRAPSRVVEVVAHAVQESTAAAGIASSAIGRVGVGVAGQCLGKTGVVLNAPNLGWRDVPFGAMLRQKLHGTALAGVPLFLQNEADVAALGETEFNPSPASDPLLYLSINQGVGAGVVFNDRLLTGNRGFAGEVGHIVLQINGPACSCGRRGCAEALIGPRAILEPSSEHAHPIAEIVRRLGAKDADVARAVKRAGNHLGVLLQNLAAAYDPGCIVIGGKMAELGDAFLQPALRTLADYAAAADLPSPSVRISRFGEDAVSIGAAALARYRLTRPLAGGAAADVSVEPAA